MATTSTTSLTKSKVRRDQLAFTLAGLLLLGVSIALRPVLLSRRAEIVTESETSLRSLAINFPRLTLGGFRGLLATWLWIQAEQDKQDRNWVQLETKYDIIASLQPYFVSVYIFHAWNQAYNLSAQWHDWDSKYKWVLDGLTYLNKGEDYNPQNVDLQIEQGNMYFQKLGGSFERIQYRRHWRADIANFHLLDDPDVAPTLKTDALRLVHEAVLRIPPENRAQYDKAATPLEQQKLRTYRTAELPDPTDRTTFKGFGISIIDPRTRPEDNLFAYRADNNPLTDPVKFRYGLSPYYFSYIQFQRAGEFVRTMHVLPTVTGMKIVDAWPAMSLRLWCRDDLYYSQQNMFALYGPGGFCDTADFSSAKVVDIYNNKVQELLDCYRNVAMIGPKSVDLFNDHIPRYNNAAIHTKHILETKAYVAIGAAEKNLLLDLAIWQKAGRKINDDLRKEFLKTIELYEKAEKETYVWVDNMYPAKVGQPYPVDRIDYEQYAQSLKARREGIQTILRLQPNEQPDLSFLALEIVER